METIMRMNLDIDYWKAKITNLWSIPDGSDTEHFTYTVKHFIYIFIFQAKGNKIVFTTLNKNNFFFFF